MQHILDIVTNMTIRVRNQSQDENPSTAGLYDDIFCVSLGKRIDIVFVPHIARWHDNWPPILPNNLDLISSRLDARLSCVALTRYSVTPNGDFGVDEFEVLMADDKGGSWAAHRTVYFINSAEFAQYQSELALIEPQLYDINCATKFSSVKDLGVIRFITQRVINSPQFDLQAVQSKY